MLMSPRQTCRPRSSAAHNGKVVPRMQIPENRWSGNYSEFAFVSKMAFSRVETENGLTWRISTA